MKRLRIRMRGQGISRDASLIVMNIFAMLRMALQSHVGTAQYFICYSIFRHLFPSVLFWHPDLLLAGSDECAKKIKRIREVVVDTDGDVWQLT